MVDVTRVTERSPVFSSMVMHAVLVVRDVSDSEVLYLPATCAGVPGDGDERLVSGVAALVEHRLDLFVPPEHLRRIGHRVVVL